MIDLHTFFGGWIAGLATGASLMRWRIRTSTPRGGNIGTTPLVRNEGRDPDWRHSINHENTNAPSGPPPLNFRRSKPVRLEEGRLVTVQGLNWPATLGDFTLAGPVDNQGAWRWYERRHHDGTIERIKVDYQLQPIKPMSTDPSITPPNELAQQWYRDAEHQLAPYYVFVARCAAQWGADQELEACCEWLRGEYDWGLAAALRLDAERRPDPPSLKEQALKTLDGLALPEDAFETIRFALEQLND